MGPVSMNLDTGVGIDLRIRIAANMGPSFDDGDPQSWRPALERLAAPGNAWRHSAREMLGLAALKAGDYDAAGRWFDQIAADRDTPQGLRSRLEVWTSIVAAGPLPKTN